MAFAPNMVRTDEDDDCPFACTAIQHEYDVGTLPQGAWLSVQWGTPSHGTSNEYCQTCKPCRSKVNVAFDGQNASPPATVCVKIDDADCTPEGTSYTRAGALTTTCGGDPTLFVFEVGSFERHVHLDCDC
jgi:hypothetical protein